MTLVETKKWKKSMTMGDIASVEEEDDPDDIPEGFHLQEESPHLYQYDQGGRLPSLLEAGRTRIRKIDKKWSDQHFGRICQSYTEHVLGNESKQADYTEWSGSS